MAEQPVYLNVYDMASINQFSSPLGVGIYHTGVEVYEVEYAYGGHSFNFSGVFEIEPKDVESLGGDTLKFRESILIGKTDFGRDDIRQIVKEIGKEFTGDKYHLLHRNCNHFSDAFIKYLCGKKIPPWINRLAYVSTCIPFLERCIPKELLIPICLENTLCSLSDEDDDLDNESQSIITTTEEDESKESSQVSTSSSSPSSALSVTSITGSFTSFKRRGSGSFRHKSSASKNSELINSAVVNSPRLARANRPFASLKR